jgi:hypothetical protein
MYCNALTQGPEGASNRTVQLWHNNQKKRVSFSDKPEPVEIEINPPQATNTNSQTMWHMPHQSILTQADLGAHQELKYLIDMARFIPTQPRNRTHPCNRQAIDVSNLPW